MSEGLPSGFASGSDSCLPVPERVRLIGLRGVPILASRSEFLVLVFKFGIFPEASTESSRSILDRTPGREVCGFTVPARA